MFDEAQRERIIEVAFERFRKFGIRRVTMDEIARTLRMSKKTLYRHFPDKEGLVRACAERIAGSIIPRVSAALDSGAPPMERIAGAWNAFSSLPKHLSAEFIADIEADYPLVWRDIDARRREVIGRFEALIADGVRSGDFRPQIHPKVAMTLVLAVIDRVMTPEVLGRGEFTPAEAVETILTIFARGMCVAPPPPIGEVRP